ncbi:hypothetical protein BH11BAC4_BH11BAC4_04030 [soil metagenome]
MSYKLKQAAQQEVSVNKVFGIEKTPEPTHE